MNGGDDWFVFSIGCKLVSADIRHKLVAIAKETCRQLRKRATAAEKQFWEQVRNRRFHGLKFYRQYPLFVDVEGRETFYVADFYCHEKGLAVEIDGKIHEYQKRQDALRDEVIRQKSIDVLRFRNEDVESNIEKVLRVLERRIYGSHSYSNTTHPLTPSLGREGECGS
jgi:very-short-patch-repair endonuclease